MMTSYIIGNILGRAVVSYALVLAILFLASKFNIRLAFKRSVAWYSWIAVFLLTILGVAANISQQGGLS